MNLLGWWWRAWDWRTAWKTPAPLPRSVPLDLCQSRLEIWNFAKAPTREPRRSWLSSEARKTLGDINTDSMSAFHQDHLAAFIEVVTSRDNGKKNAWGVQQAQEVVKQVLDHSPSDMDVWVLEHTTHAAGVRVHHRRGTWTLFEDAPLRMLSAEMLAQAALWLWAIKQRELGNRPSLSPLRTSLGQGPEAMARALETMTWDWAGVMDVVDTLHHIAHPVEPYFLPSSPWYSPTPDQQKSWLNISGTYGGYHEWEESPSMVAAVERLCKAIPSHLMRAPTDEERRRVAQGLAPEPWDGFSRVVELLDYWIIPIFWLAHRDAVTLWTDPRAAHYWLVAFGDAYFQAGDDELVKLWTENPQGREENGVHPKPEWQNPHGCVDFQRRPLGMMHQQWGNRVLPLLPRALQHEALDEALWRVLPHQEAIPANLVDLEEGKQLLELKEMVPDWPRWPLAELAVTDYAAYQAQVRADFLGYRLEPAQGAQGRRQRL